MMQLLVVSIKAFCLRLWLWDGIAGGLFCDHMLSVLILQQACLHIIHFCAVEMVWGVLHEGLSYLMSLHGLKDMLWWRPLRISAAVHSRLL